NSSSVPTLNTFPTRRSSDLASVRHPRRNGGTRTGVAIQWKNQILPEKDSRLPFPDRRYWNWNGPRYTLVHKGSHEEPGTPRQEPATRNECAYDSPQNHLHLGTPPTGMLSTGNWRFYACLWPLINN